MSLLLSFDSLKNTETGFPVSSISNRTSERSKAMAPEAKRFSRSFFAKSFSRSISVAKSPLPVSIIS